MRLRNIAAITALLLVLNGCDASFVIDDTTNSSSSHTAGVSSSSTISQSSTQEVSSSSEALSSSLSSSDEILSSSSANISSSSEAFSSSLSSNDGALSSSGSNISSSATSSFSSDSNMQVRAFDILGIPYVTDPVPGAVMPTLPSGADYNDHEWIGTYDPVSEPTPAPTGGANEWVVSVHGDDDSAGNGGKGTLQLPRATLPPIGTTFAAGSKIFIIGDNTPLPSAYDDNRKIDFTTWQGTGGSVGAIFNGTKEAPCWIIGIDKPRISTRATVFKGTHYIFDGIVTEDNNVNGGGSIQIEDSQYVCFRNGWMYGRSLADYGGNVFSISSTSAQMPTKFVILYNTEIAYHGDWLNPSTKKDVHGFRPMWWTRYTWCINNHIHHCQGDGTQSANSERFIPEGYENDFGVRPHYIYVGGNTMHDNRENAIDNKNSFHVIDAQNECYNHITASSSDGTAIVLSNNNEGNLTGWHWALFNNVHDNAIGIRDSGDRDDEQSFMIGNLLYDNSKGLVVDKPIGSHSGNNNLYVINNTVARGEYGLYVHSWGSGELENNLYCIGNLTYEHNDTHMLGNTRYTQAVLQHHLADNLLTPVKMDTTTWSLYDHVLTDQDPLFDDVDNNVFTLQYESPAIGLIPQIPQAYQTFETMYGISIAYDFAKKPLPQTDVAAGCFQ